MDYCDKTDDSRTKKVSSNFRIQETFLNHLRREKIRVTIQLFNQSIIEGLIIGFDQESLVVIAHGTQQLIYKTAVVCIKPFEELHLIFNDARSKSRPRNHNITYPRFIASQDGNVIRH
ncbi:MAG: RNA chaperone Hfq [Clostridiales bacterium]|jgi:RNA chaperone Hfq|nr:RNA chaperone Hfq [Clostridiales bacterium]MCK9349624.1 RNA chaperone Hfq [Clostridiales bacterium]MDD3418751.1 RNA chaperone Hfq [Eubacteriales bacterium]MDD3539830.1 RNA chaperone Hfq [Eubacteriales bacterium]MDY0119386.1 RNA chaperone Hfq [Clostridia bacterium]